MLSRITIYEVWMPLNTEFRTSFGSTKNRPALIVEVEDDEGYIGWGEVVAGEGPWYNCETIGTAWHVLESYIIPYIGPETSITTYNESVSRIRGHNMAKAGLEMALWDLEARKKGVPLWKLLGGVRREVIVGVSIGIKESVRQLLNTIKNYSDQGYKRIKIKIKPGWDIEVVEKIRREYPDIMLQVDANAAYTYLDAPRLARLDDYNLLMIEQPFHYDDLIWHADFQSMIKTPICLDESIKSPHQALEALRLNSAKIINLKPGRVGGITPSLKIHQLWSLQAGRPLWIGGMLETGIGRGHLVALATLPGVKYPSDISASNRYYQEDIVDKPWELTNNSTIRVRDKPGIGVNLEYETLEKYTRRKKTYKIQ